MEIVSCGIWKRLNVVRLDRFFQGKCVTTPDRFNEHNDDRLPLKSIASRTGAGTQLRLIVNSLRRGIEQERCGVRYWRGSTVPLTVRDLSRLMCGTTKGNASLR